MQNAKSKYAGCDYFRGTAPHESLWPEWEAVLLSERLREVALGGKEKDGWLMGYYGPMLAHAFGGVGKQGMCLQFSSTLADGYWRAAKRDCAHVARVDFQVTLPMGPKQGEYIEAAYEEAKGRTRRRGRQVDPEMRIRPSGARSVTFGSRKSEIYGRIYDKERESGAEEYAGCIRWEVEYHNDAAGHVCDYLVGREQHRSDSALLVREQFAKWGVTRQWGEGLDFEVAPVAKRGRTFESSEAWIAAQVAPTLRWLAENGREMEVAAALLTAYDKIGKDDEKLCRLSKLLRECAMTGV